MNSFVSSGRASLAVSMAGLLIGIATVLLLITGFDFASGKAAGWGMVVVILAQAIALTLAVLADAGAARRAAIFLSCCLTGLTVGCAAFMW